MAGPALDCFGEMPLGIGKLSVVKEDIAEIGVRLGMAGVNVQSPRKGRLRLSDTLEVEQHNAVIVISVREAGVQCYRFAVMLLCRPRLAKPGVQRNKIDVRLRECRVDLQCAFVCLDGFRQPTCRIEADSTPQLIVRACIQRQYSYFERIIAGGCG